MFFKEGLPKVYDFSTATDLQVLEAIKTTYDDNEMHIALKTLFERYSHLITKMKFKMIDAAKKCHVVLDTDCYEQDAFFRFIMAVRTCRLKDLHARNDPTWCFFIVFWGYLSSFNRTTVYHAIEAKNNTTEDTLTYNDGESSLKSDFHQAEHGMSAEDTAIDNEQRDAFWEAVDNSFKKFTPEQRKIWEMKEAGTKVLAISKATQQPQRAVKEELLKMKHVLKNELLRVIKHKNCESDHLKLLLDNDGYLMKSP
jgi:hypothetical protein